MDMEELLEFDMRMVIGLVLWVVMSPIMAKMAFVNVSMLWKILFVIIMLPLCVFFVKLRLR